MSQLQEEDPLYQSFIKKFPLASRHTGSLASNVNESKGSKSGSKGVIESKTNLDKMQESKPKYQE
ncbi:MAG: hypothetical protein KDD45_15915 [Bdellovibrionales bacterium]|nr:hypothetical protein [Bdellovibrionales bacterium]